MLPKTSGLEMMQREHRREAAEPGEGHGKLYLGEIKNE